MCGFARALRRCAAVARARRGHPRVPWGPPASSDGRGRARSLATACARCRKAPCPAGPGPRRALRGARGCPARASQPDGLPTQAYVPRRGVGAPRAGNSGAKLIKVRERRVRSRDGLRAAPRPERRLRGAQLHRARERLPHRCRLRAQRSRLPAPVELLGAVRHQHAGGVGDSRPTGAHLADGARS